MRKNRADRIAEELSACSPKPLHDNGFNPACKIPFGCSVGHVRKAMQEFLDFLGFVNTQLNSRKIPRFESFLMPANFSSMVGEFMAAGIPKHCRTLVKNRYHNGHPDLIPAGVYPNDAVQYGDKGIEIKASRHRSGWQGHNAENVWLLVFVFDSNTLNDSLNDEPPRPFGFVKVAGSQITKDDWKFSGRSETSRRTITASVTASGYAKLMANLIYEDPEVKENRRRTSAKR